MQTLTSGGPGRACFTESTIGTFAALLASAGLVSQCMCAAAAQLLAQQLPEQERHQGPDAKETRNSGHPSVSHVQPASS